MTIEDWLVQAEIALEKAMALALRQYGSSAPVSVLLQHTKDLAVSARKLAVAAGEK